MACHHFCRRCAGAGDGREAARRFPGRCAAVPAEQREGGHALLAEWMRWRAPRQKSSADAMRRMRGLQAFAHVAAVTAGGMAGGSAGHVAMQPWDPTQLPHRHVHVCHAGAPGAHCVPPHRFPGVFQQPGMPERRRRTRGNRGSCAVTAMALCNMCRVQPGSPLLCYSGCSCHSLEFASCFVGISASRWTTSCTVWKHCLPPCMQPIRSIPFPLTGPHLAGRPVAHGAGGRRSAGPRRLVQASCLGAVGPMGTRGSVD